MDVPGLLPRRGVKHLIKHTIGREAASIMAEDAVDAVQACSSEFINLVVSEARQRVAREGREVVTETDLLAVLSLMGFRGFHEPLKSYLQECEAEDREAKRPKATPLQEGHGAATKEGACSADAGVTAKEGACSADAGMDAATEERACSAGAGMSTAITGGSACSGEIMADAATES